MKLAREYHYILQQLKNKYEVSVKVEHKFVHEIYEGIIPICKLLYGVNKSDVRGDRILVCFHLDLDSVDAIQWYLRIKSLHSSLYITACYYKDDNNETFLGQGAELIKKYKDEQRILSNWQRDEEDTKKYIDQRIIGRSKHKVSNYDFTDKNAAIKEFNKLTTEDEDKCH